MALDLVDFERKAKKAVKAFWGNSEAAEKKQKAAGKSDQGNRARVTGGQNMNGFLSIFSDIVNANGLANAQIFHKGADLTLPGFFRPTKKWDFVVVHKGQLIVAIETKSQASSIGKNYNNRTEETIGSAHDIWTAYRENAFGKQPRPFVGWIMLVADSDESNDPRGEKSTHFPILNEFRDASYLGRYDLLCQKMIKEQLYTSATIIASPPSAKKTGIFTCPSPMTDLKSFVSALAGHIAAEAARLN